MTGELKAPERALAIGAHPDDIDFNCAGTLAKWARGGCSVFYLVLTDGSRGSWDPDEDPASLVVARRHEQLAAHSVVCGLEHARSRERVSFLASPDGELEPGLRQRAEVCAAIRSVQPDVVLGHDPWRRYRLHPDHRNAGFLTTDGIVAARDPLFFPEQALAPHRPSTLLLFEAEDPDHAEDVNAFADVKLAALLEHKSQLRTTMGISANLDDDDGVWSEQVATFASRLATRQAEAGRPFGLALAETFKRIDLH